MHRILDLSRPKPSLLSLAPLTATKCGTRSDTTHAGQPAAPQGQLGLRMRTGRRRLGVNVKVLPGEAREERGTRHRAAGGGGGRARRVGRRPAAHLPLPPPPLLPLPPPLLPLPLLFFVGMAPAARERAAGRRLWTLLQAANQAECKRAREGESPQPRCFAAA